MDFSCLGGGIGSGITHWMFGTSSHYVGCGYCGRSEIVRFSKISKDQGPSWNFCLLEF